MSSRGSVALVRRRRERRRRPGRCRRPPHAPRGGRTGPGRPGAGTRRGSASRAGCPECPPPATARRPPPAPPGPRPRSRRSPRAGASRPRGRAPTRAATRPRARSWVPREVLVLAAGTSRRSSTVSPGPENRARSPRRAPGSDVDQEEPGEVLLGLGVRAVGGQRPSVVPAVEWARAGCGQGLAADQLAVLGELSEQRLEARRSSRRAALAGSAWCSATKSLVGCPQGCGFEWIRMTYFTVCSCRWPSGPVGPLTGDVGARDPFSTSWPNRVPSGGCRTWR